MNSIKQLRSAIEQGFKLYSHGDRYATLIKVDKSTGFSEWMELTFSYCPVLVSVELVGRANKVDESTGLSIRNQYGGYEQVVRYRELHKIKCQTSSINKLREYIDTLDHHSSLTELLGSMSE